MATNDIIQGYPDGKFRPNHCINRVELLKIVLETANVDLNSYDAELFSDTKAGQWYTPYVIAGRDIGFINNYPDGTFKPERCVNRVEAIKIALGAFDIDEYSNDVGWRWTDVKPTEWYFDYFFAAQDKNLLGFNHAVDKESDGPLQSLYYPSESMTRKEVAEMLYRIKAMVSNAKNKYETNIEPK